MQRDGTGEVDSGCGRGCIGEETPEKHRANATMSPVPVTTEENAPEVFVSNLVMGSCNGQPEELEFHCQQGT